MSQEVALDDRSHGIVEEPARDFEARDERSGHGLRARGDRDLLFERVTELEWRALIEVALDLARVEIIDVGEGQGVANGQHAALVVLPVEYVHGRVVETAHSNVPPERNTLKASRHTAPISAM